MSRVLFIQNGEGEHAGLFARVLGDLGVTLEVIHAWQGEPVPTAPNGWAGIIIGGGSMSAYEQQEYPFLTAEEVLIEAARAKERPVFGICLGAQLMASTLGGKVFANAEKEIGLYEVRFTPEAER